MFQPYRPNVEVDSTALSAVPGLMSSSNRHDVSPRLMLVFIKLQWLLATLENLRFSGKFISTRIWEIIRIVRAAKGE